MKLLSVVTSVLLLSLFSSCAGSKKGGSQALKARLEIQGICSNYTIKLLEGSLNKSLIEASWKDETTGTTYTDVFGLANPCNFPATLKKGDEFYFVIDTAKQQDCAVCMAYYPTPQKKLSIKVVPKP
jgi:hypothetical protein